MVTIRQIESVNDFETFNNLNADTLHVVKMSASWCGPCRVLESTIKNLDKEKIGETLFGEIDVDDDNLEDIVSKYEIRVIPVLLFMKNGEVIKRTEGNINAESIYGIINEIS